MSCMTTKPTVAGNDVEYAMKQEAPDEYIFIADISIGEGLEFGAKSISDLKVKMKNMTAELGGDFLVIDTIEKKDVGIMFGPYAGTGRVYKKPDSID